MSKIGQLDHSIAMSISLFLDSVSTCQQAAQKLDVLLSVVHTYTVDVEMPVD